MKVVQAFIYSIYSTAIYWVPTPSIKARKTPPHGIKLNYIAIYENDTTDAP